jgi:DNA-directed RNA polymerase specialized sigma24 family protein|tara:strand:+ start:2370 stop:2912 length:543 start_codon:yes stop_codon:yes gene_type:complete
MKKKSEHYVDNKQFLQAMIEYKKSCVLAESKNELKPPVSNYIGECFLKIANHLSYRPNFINYTYKEEMISDGIENCLQYVSNFNPDKSNNPFAYFTQIIYYAFIRRIQKEKKQQTIKRKLILKSGFDVETATNIDDKAYQDAYIEYLAKNMLVTEDDVDKPKEKKVKKKKKAKTLLEFFM